jgi:L-malate glycosyltransferase
MVEDPMVKVLHMISGGETGGSRKHVVTLLSKFPSENVCLLVFQDGPLAQEAREAGIRVQLIKQSSRYDLSVLTKVISFIRKEKFDILHTHGPRANLIGFLIHRVLPCIWVTTIHSDPKLDFMKRGWKGAIFTKLNLISLQRVHYFFAVSERFKENLMELGIPGHKIQTVYNGIDFTPKVKKAEHLQQQLGLLSDEFIMTMVARLHPVKCHELVLRAFQNADLPKGKLLLIGDGPIRQELEKLVEQLGLSQQVKFLGFRKDVQELYSISHVALLASQSESFPLVLLEAANEEVPVISTDVGGVRELISDDNKGWIVPVGDEIAYCQAMKEAYQHFLQGTLLEKGVELRKHAEKYFSLDHLYQLTVETYEQLLKRKN